MGQQGYTGNARPPVWEFLVLALVVSFLSFAFIRALDNLAEIVRPVNG